MSIIKQLASSQGLKGNEANISLAKEIGENNDKQAIDELVQNLLNDDKKIPKKTVGKKYQKNTKNLKLINNKPLLFTKNF